jgi:hypothetical protein
MPDEGVAAHVHAVRYAEVHDGVRRCVIERGRTRHDIPELHGVLAYQAVKFANEGGVVHRRTRGKRHRRAEMDAARVGQGAQGLSLNNPCRGSKYQADTQSCLFHGELQAKTVCLTCKGSEP